MIKTSGHVTNDLALPARIGFFTAMLVCVALAALAVSRSSAEPTTTVRVGIANASSDAAFFIADKRGYFKHEGIQVSFTAMTNMIAPLGTGQLDVGGISTSAALYNAAARGVDIKIVADKGSTPPGHGYQPLLVRKDLVDSGKVKELRDLKGLKVAGFARGSASTSTLNEALNKAGLKFADVELVYMGFPQHVLALQNKAVDASMTTEPSATKAVQLGAAVRFVGDDVVYPNHQLAVVLYGGDFIKRRPDAAKKFMRAYIKAVRDYNDALIDGKLTGPKAQDIIAIMTEYTEVKDPSVYRAITSHGTNPDGRVYEASLKRDLQFYKEQGLIEGDINVEQVVDHSFVDAVVRELGPYRARK